MTADPEDPVQVARLRYALYMETLRAHMPQEQFDLLMKIMRMWAESGDGTVRLKHDSPEKELFTPISAHRFFKEAVAVCWEKATAAASADGPSTRRAYYLNRFRTRAALAFSPAPSGIGTRTPASQAGAGTRRPSAGYS
ncbi:hypothetical protein ACFY3G_50985 [Streptomyces phaeochromogenes]|uniref:hypothetical protein n=1 Tax=Streptomyces phaeochromogenes TaxID=1923 RepID=UPI003679C49A